MQRVAQKARKQESKKAKLDLKMKLRNQIISEK